MIWKYDFTHFFGVDSERHFGIFVFVLHKLSDLCKKLPFVLPEWQEVAQFFRGNQYKTS